METTSYVRHGSVGEESREHDWHCAYCSIGPVCFDLWASIFEILKNELVRGNISLEKAQRTQSANFRSRSWMTSSPLMPSSPTSSDILPGCSWHVSSVSLSWKMLPIGTSSSIRKSLSVSKGFESGALVELVSFAFEDKSRSEHKERKMAFKLPIY